MRGSDSGWYPTHVQEEWLIGEISEVDIENVKQRYQLMPRRLDQFIQFLNSAKPEDRFFRYIDPTDGVTGLVIIRKGRPIIEFKATSNI